MPNINTPRGWNKSNLQTTAIYCRKCGRDITTEPCSKSGEREYVCRDCWIVILIANRERALGRGLPGAPRPIANDGEEATPLYAAMLEEVKRVLVPGACCCCCCGGG
ncbi:MAG: hypothetical protein HRF49_07545 [bacterium]